LYRRRGGAGIKISQKEVEKMIFGNKLFEMDNNDSPLIKLKRDVIKKMGLID
jgi:hypothetical protein